MPPTVHGSISQASRVRDVVTVNGVRVTTQDREAGPWCAPRPTSPELVVV
jgi:hypothetical protein